MFLTTCLLLSSLAFPADVNQVSLQAAYVKKFIDYIEWPAISQEKFAIGIVNYPAMVKAINETFAEKVISGKSVEISHLEKVDPKVNYNILIFNQLPEGSLKILSKVEKRGLLVISFDDSGNMEYAQINFFLDQEGKLRFDINQTSTLEHGLKINSRLLNLARSLK